MAKTEQSIEKLEKHVTNRTCLISLQYSAKPNIMPDPIFDREIREIKQQAWQSLVLDLNNLHKKKAQEPYQKGFYHSLSRWINKLMGNLSKECICQTL